MGNGDQHSPELDSHESDFEVKGSDSEMFQPLRRSERTRHPPRRLDYPHLGNLLVTVVKSLFQGLSTAFIDSLKSDDRDYWLQSQAFEVTTPVAE